MYINAVIRDKIRFSSVYHVQSDHVLDLMGYAVMRLMPCHASPLSIAVVISNRIQDNDTMLPSSPAVEAELI